MEQSTNQDAGGMSDAEPVKPKRGGVRAGAGRPKKTEIYAENIAEAEALICKELPKLLAKYFELAQGVTMKGKSGRDGAPTVYERPPDGKVIADLLNRVMGKPVERVETENMGEANETTIIILPDNGRNYNAPTYPYDPEKDGLTYGEDN
ncbi:MAG: hypothetical protein ACRYFS_00670 [Janthinobacterium lividum]